MKLALVTAGLRRLGAAIAARLAGEGYALALHAHHAAEPDPALQAAIEAAGVAHAIFPADLADADAVAALVDQVADRFGAAPTLLVNNASRFEDSEWATFGMADLDRHFRVNAFAPALLAQRLAARLGDGEGVVVNILDQRVAAPPIDQAAYTASKLALAGMTEAMARAFAPRVRVNAVAPGLTLPTADYSEAQMARLAAAMPLGRLPAPEDIADAVAYMAGARAVTGQVLFVDGGARLEAFRRDFVHMAREA